MNLPKLKTRDKMLLGAGIGLIAIVAIRNYYVDTSKVLKKLKEDVTIPETRFLVIRDVVAPGEKDYNEILKKVEDAFTLSRGKAEPDFVNQVLSSGNIGSIPKPNTQISADLKTLGKQQLGLSDKDFEAAQKANLI